jgi:hypothetical protein
MKKCYTDLISVSLVYALFGQRLRKKYNVFSVVCFFLNEPNEFNSVLISEQDRPPKLIIDIFLVSLTRVEVKAPTRTIKDYKEAVKEIVYIEFFFGISPKSN